MILFYAIVFLNRFLHEFLQRCEHYYKREVHLTLRLKPGFRGKNSILTAKYFIGILFKQNRNKKVLVNIFQNLLKRLSTISVLLFTVFYFPGKYLNTITTCFHSANKVFFFFFLKIVSRNFIHMQGPFQRKEKEFKPQSDYNVVYLILTYMNFLNRFLLMDYHCLNSLKSNQLPLLYTTYITIRLCTCVTYFVS